MAKKCLVVKCREQRQKFKVRQYRRCQVCGRPRGVYKRFDLCRICLRQFAHKGLIPGMVKASW